MRKLFLLFVPVAIIFSLAACTEDENDVTVLIKPDFKKVVNVPGPVFRGPKASYTAEELDCDGNPCWHYKKINGKWYPANPDGTLTAKGETRRKNDEAMASMAGGC